MALCDAVFLGHGCVVNSLNVDDERRFNAKDCIGGFEGVAFDVEGCDESVESVGDDHEVHMRRTVRMTIQSLQQFTHRSWNQHKPTTTNVAIVIVISREGAGSVIPS